MALDVIHCLLGLGLGQQPEPVVAGQITERKGEVRVREDFRRTWLGTITPRIVVVSEDRRRHS